MSEPFSISFTIDWVTKLAKQLGKLRRQREAEMERITRLFADPEAYAKWYVEPFCQHLNPNVADEVQAVSIRAPVFPTIQGFLNRDIGPEPGGENQLFVLGDAGMGKTSLLVMLRLANLMAFWPSQFHCEIFRLGPTTLSEVKKLEHPRSTVLLLDSLDEDPSAQRSISDRMRELLDATKHFFRVIVTCRTQFIPRTAGVTERPGFIEVHGYRCPSLYLSYFSARQVRQYLALRFPASIFDRLYGNVAARTERAERLLALMQTLQMRPMLLARIDELLDATHDMRTGYDVYRTLIDGWLAREVRKKAIAGRLKKEALWDACTEFALYLENRRSREATTTELLEFAQSLPDTLRLLDLSGRALLTCAPVANGEDAGAMTFRFAHYTIREFLLARHLLAGRRLPPDLYIRGTNQLGRFLSDTNGEKHEDYVARIARARFDPTPFDGIPFVQFLFQRCEFKRASFVDASFVGALFESCSLESADFRCADLRRARFLNCTGIDTANFADAVYDEHTSGLTEAMKKKMRRDTRRLERLLEGD